MTGSRGLVSALALSCVGSSFAQAQFQAQVFVPQSSIAEVSDTGVRAHTNYLISTVQYEYPVGGPLLACLHPQEQIEAPFGYAPSWIRQVYGVTKPGSGAIAIVTAYHYPTSLADFNVFSTMYGLPKETSTNPLAATNAHFQVVYANGAKPAVNSGWAQESALDIEWTHAVATGAKIILVEAASNGFSDLFAAVNKAKSLSGVKQVTMSWGGSEFSGESAYDGYFASPTVTFFASSGDTGGVSCYPAQSPRVVGVGGTNLSTSMVQRGWGGSGGGQSPYEPKPAFQSVVAGLTKRGGPDVSAVADPATGCAVYCGTANQGHSGWMVFGGTSLASPVCAGIANAGGAARGQNELTWIYGHKTLFKDVTVGKAGAYPCTTGWDKVTGWGTPASQGSF